MRVLLSAALILSAVTASAAEAPQLPANAKKLTATRILALFDGKTLPYTSFTNFGVANGMVTYDFKSQTNHGTYQLGSFKGSFNGRIHLSGDKFCYQVKSDAEHCDDIYLAGKDIYNVGPNGIVESVNQRP